MENLKIGDQVEVSLDEDSSLFVIQTIEDSNIYISDHSGNLSLLIFDNGQYYVYGAENIPYQVKFLTTEEKLGLTGFPEIDLQILSQLDDQTLKSACSINKYTQNLCSKDELWQLKLENKFGPDIFGDKSETQTFQDLYLELINILNAKFFGKYYSDARRIRKHPASPADLAAQGGKLEFLKWYLQNYPETSIDAQTANFAIVNGNLNIVSWLAENKNIYPSQLALNTAQKRGYEDIVNWAKEKGLISDIRETGRRGRKPNSGFKRKLF